MVSGNKYLMKLSKQERDILTSLKKEFYVFTISTTTEVNTVQ